MMSEHLAVDADEHALIEEPSPKILRIRIARYVSNLLTPAVISLPSVVLVALYRTQNPTLALYYACITLFFLSFGPLVYILIGVRLGKFSDTDVSRRSERKGPFLFSIASVLAGLIILQLTNGPKNLQTLLIITAASGVIMMITTLWWKISIHASSLAGAVTMLTVLYGAIVLPAFLLVVLVSWSRVVLRRHTVAQVLAGSLVSIALATAILLLRGI
jgi:membrane-associated phospholipid phosphatase